MKLIAHRGLWINKDEKNKFIAINRAIKSDNYFGFECDIRQTKDNNYVIHHDAIYKNRLISSHYKNYFKKEKMLFLEDVLKINTEKIKLIEIKDSNINIKEINKIFNLYNNNLYVMSFNNKVIEKLSKEEHNYKLGILNYIINSDKKYKYDFICLLNNFTNNKLVEKYLNNKVEVFIYGITNGNFDYGNRVFYIIDNNIISKKCT